MPRKQETGPFAFRVSGRVEYLTPQRFITTLGPFDLDPCGSVIRPWPTAKEHYTEGGLEKLWRGFIWLNPPYGKSSNERGWVLKLAAHGDGIAMLFSKTETLLWQDIIFKHATAINFLARRVSFCNTDGSATAGYFAGSAPIAFGVRAKNHLCKAHDALPGKIIIL